MKTKIVYVVTSSSDDVFWEEAWVSAWSSRYHNPDAHIALVCDKETLESAKESYRAKSLEIFDETITVDFDPGISQKQRSRWLKTNLREYIRGDFLYIDTDTVITGCLNEIDDWNFDIGMVKNEHHSRSVSPFCIQLYEKAYKETLPVDVPYYNAGVMFVKDTEKAKSFFCEWHQNWRKLGDIIDYTDQTPLVRTIIENGSPITEISGVYNCQISLSVKYLHHAKIIHFFHCWFHPFTAVSPFMDKLTYKGVKDRQGIDDELKQKIINCNNEFEETSAPFSEDVLSFLDSTTIRFVLLPLFFKKRTFYQRADKIVHFIYKLVRF
jgi:hypothetical protein